MHFWARYRNYQRYQLQLFLLALGFFSRIPISSNIPYSNTRMNQAGRYFGLVGLLLGALCGSVFIALIQLFPSEIAVLLSIAFSLILTGCFHEDGLADMADGIGGGMTIERRLTIMKDSRIGTYGGSALIISLLAKFLLLKHLSEGLLGGNFSPLSTFFDSSPLISIFIVWLVAYTLSRAVAASLIFAIPYVSDPLSSKSKPLAEQQSLGELLVIIISALLPCLLLRLPLLAVLIISALIFRALFKRWLMAKLGGFTGDCLGAAQQLMEILIYLLLLALLNPNSAVALS